MGTVATATNISGVSNIGAEMFMATYTVALDTTHATGYQTVDLTDDFKYIHAMWFAGNDTIADNAYKIDAVLPAAGTAIDATNVQLTFHYSPAKTGNAENAEVFDPVNAGDLGDIGDLRIVVIGKQAT